MRLVSIYSILLITTSLLFSCSREDDEELYQVQYQSPGVDSVKLDESTFKLSQTTIELGEDVGFSSEALDQVVSWEVNLSQTVSEDITATKKIVFITKQLQADKHVWSGEYDGLTPFNSTEPISVSVEIYNSEVAFSGGVISLK